MTPADKLLALITQLEASGDPASAIIAGNWADFSVGTLQIDLGGGVLSADDVEGLRDDLDELLANKETAVQVAKIIKSILPLALSAIL